MFVNTPLTESLANYDFQVFLIDNAGSMTRHWPQLRQVVELIVYMVKDCDPDGLDIHFTRSSNHLRSKELPTILAYLEKNSPKANDLADIVERFGRIIQKYQDKIGSKKSIREYLFRRKLRRLSLYVLTDAAWPSKCYQDLTITIESLVDSLCKHHLTTRQVGIQFIQFGDSREGTAGLNKLDRLDLKM